MERVFKSLKKSKSAMIRRGSAASNRVFFGGSVAPKQAAKPPPQRPVHDRVIPLNRLSVQRFFDLHRFKYPPDYGRLLWDNIPEAEENCNEPNPAYHGGAYRGRLRPPVRFTWDKDTTQKPPLEATSFNFAPSVGEGHKTRLQL